LGLHAGALIANDADEIDLLDAACQRHRVPNTDTLQVLQVCSSQAVTALARTEFSSIPPSAAVPDADDDPASTAAVAHGVAGGCSAPDGGARERDAIAWAESVLDSTEGAGGWCDLFVANAFGQPSSGYTTAYTHYLAMLRAGRVASGDRDVPAGALAFFDATPTDGGGGHVMLSIGDGTFISSDVGPDGGLIHGGRVGITTLELAERSSGAYLGWSWAPESWGGATIEPS
jgi:hypothetical protein